MGTSGLMPDPKRCFSVRLTERNIRISNKDIDLKSGPVKKIEQKEQMEYE